MSTGFFIQQQHHGTFSKIDHTLGHKENLSKCKKTEITPCILSDHSALKLELNNKNNSRNIQPQIIGG
jgi:endonuclease/exonuclease/phosphatase family metal-dependent hydrolase